MKKIITAFILSTAASLAVAHDKVFGDHPEHYGTPFLDQKVSPDLGDPQKGEDDLYVSIRANPKLSKWDPDAKVEPWVASDDWKTKGEAYQSIWVDATE